MMNNRICILMSTYNGEKYLVEQLNSISRQECDSEIILCIRDDGSKDSTLKIIEQYSCNGAIKEKIIIKGKNVGVQKSFLELMRLAPKADYYAFCDQDDYWIKNKLQIAINCLKKSDSKKSLLFYSGYNVVDDKLNNLEKITIHKDACHSITKIMFHNKVPGCVMVFNRTLLEACNAIEIENVRMHDMFVLSVAYLLGQVYQSNEHLIKYRQHNANVLGYKKKKLNLSISKLRTKEKYSMSELANCLLLHYGNDIDVNNRKQLEIISEYRNSLKAWVRLLLSSETVSQNRFRSTVSIKMKILFRTI